MLRSQKYLKYKSILLNLCENWKCHWKLIVVINRYDAKCYMIPLNISNSKHNLIIPSFLSQPYAFASSIEKGFILNVIWCFYWKKVVRLISPSLADCHRTIWSIEKKWTNLSQGMGFSSHTVLKILARKLLCSLFGSHCSQKNYNRSFAATNPRLSVWETTLKGIVSKITNSLQSKDLILIRLKNSINIMQNNKKYSPSNNRIYQQYSVSLEVPSLVIWTCGFLWHCSAFRRWPAYLFLLCHAL